MLATEHNPYDMLWEERCAREDYYVHCDCLTCEWCAVNPYYNETTACEGEEEYVCLAHTEDKELADDSSVDWYTFDGDVSHDLAVDCEFYEEV